MGQEIDSTRFRHHDFHRFERRLVSEMALLHEYFRVGRFASDPPRIGLELEMWLIDGQGRPQPRNEEFLSAVDLPSVVAELSQYNVEFNVQHQDLQGSGIHQLETELSETWSAADRVARSMDLNLVAIGILPTIQARQLNRKTMSRMSRFYALNEQILRLRRGRPIQLRIDGQERLRLRHKSVMLEAAATSLQLHLQVPVEDSVRYYNAAQIASSVVTGLSANSPLAFGKLLWAETRIPVFEQAVDIGGPFPRVAFGNGYVLDSLEEIFLENRICHPVLLPVELPEPVELLPHVRLHNGTIWRWNRPLIGFDETGRPHVRVEHRVMPAGPTLIDMLANIAFAAGLIEFLAKNFDPPEEKLPFDVCHANFVSAARLGLTAPITWLDGGLTTIRDLIRGRLLAAAEQGLKSLNISSVDILRYLDILANRVDCGRNGAVWQTEFINRHGRDLEQLTREYLARQRDGRPVHEWDL